MRTPTVSEAERRVVLGEPGGLRDLLLANGPAIADGMQGLCEAVGKLAAVRDALDKAALRAPGTAASAGVERVRLGLHRACSHLVFCAGALPNELWAALLDRTNVGVEELRERLNAGVKARAA